MIKLSNKIYIHWLTAVMFVSAYITRTLGFTAMMYSVMFIHELAHLIAARFLRLGIGRIIFYPFGLCLNLKTRILCSFSDEIILYISGPLINALIAAGMCLAGRMNLFFYNNLALFILNLLPISQLDGGRIMSSILESRLGQRRAEVIIKVVSALLSILLLLFIIYFDILNVNTVSFVAFLAGNMVTQKRKYNRDCLREMVIRNKDKKKLRANIIVTNNDIPPSRLVSEFSPIRHTVVFSCDTNGEICGIKTDTQIISELIK